MKTSVFFSALAASLFAITSAQGQSFQFFSFAPLDEPSSFVSTSSSGWQTAFQTFTAVGLDLNWYDPGVRRGAGSPYELLTWEITNKSDIIGSAPNMDRYISFVYDPSPDLIRNHYQLALFWLPISHASFTPGESFQIRSSYDNFNEPIITFNGDERRDMPGGMSTTGNVPSWMEVDEYGDAYLAQNHMSAVQSGPLELRFYYYGTNPDGSAADGPYFAQAYVNQISSRDAIPEPSSILLLGLSSSMAFLHRRRRN